MRTLTACLLALSLTACATAMHDEWTQKRGYTEAEIAETLPYHEQYGWQVAAARNAGYGSPAEMDVRRRIAKVFCACIKKLGDKCQRKPASLKGADRELWAKGNAAEMILYKAAASSMVPGPIVIDPLAECN
jgi:hypothetical protein